MAERRERRSAGLGFGQLITLTFGFLLASLFIFVFGFWVGHDMADQRSLHQRQPLRVALDAPPTPLPVATALPPAVASPAVPAALPPTAAPTHAAPVFSATPMPPPATPTAALAVSTATKRPPQTPTAAAGSWTVLAYSTNDTVRAVMLARTLRAKGYDASTGTKQVGNATWYTVKVGRFRDRAAAKAMENKLREAEGLEAATVMSQ
ncbi:SPOR domain-containing protein [bacterium]|nr:SPOR domain-containing protein [bacterium]